MTRRSSPIIACLGSLACLALLALGIVVPGCGSSFPDVQATTLPTGGPTVSAPAAAHPSTPPVASSAPAPPTVTAATAAPPPAAPAPDAGWVNAIATAQQVAQEVATAAPFVPGWGALAAGIAGGIATGLGIARMVAGGTKPTPAQVINDAAQIVAAVAGPAAGAVSGAAAATIREVGVIAGEIAGTPKT